VVNLHETVAKLAFPVGGWGNLHGGGRLGDLPDGGAGLGDLRDGGAGLPDGGRIGLPRICKQLVDSRPPLLKLTQVVENRFGLKVPDDLLPAQPMAPPEERK